MVSMICTGCDAPEQKHSSSAPHGHHHDPPHGGSLIQLGNEQYHLELVMDRSTGETVGDTAEFQADLAPLNGENTFEGIIQEVHIQNSSFTKIPFSFPGGNE